ncbi:MAG: TadG family pilus assembly protein [Thermodesulfobacteriota bacterium]
MKGGRLTMSNPSKFFELIRNRKGTVAVIIATSTVAFIGLGALAIDLGHLFVVRNELQNAADAGALAGARFLYDQNGTAVNATANLTAYNAAIANRSETTPVEVQWTGGNEGDIQRGHWSFATRTFTPNDSLLPISLWDTSTEELDANPNFINAIRVKTRREDKPAASFLAGIFGMKNFLVSTDAIAYIGFAGTLAPLEVDEPIAICSQSILFDGKYSCTVGRMINSGKLLAAHETAGWTDYNQVNPCLGGTNASDVRSLVCGEGNPDPIILGSPVATNGGEIASAFKKVRDCWASKTGKTKPWKLTLLVIDCPGNNVRPCEVVAGVVTVDVVWITGEGEDPKYGEAPVQMDKWSSPDPDGKVRWASFVKSFGLKNLDNTPAPYEKKSIYFLPDCTPHIPTGRSGGQNFGILAKIPVLVK